MKHWLLIGCIVFGYNYGNAQLWEERYRKEHTGLELSVGDTMPDISLGTVINNHTGKTRFSQFRGKLVILDFWATTCSSCMRLLPHMEMLQKQFRDSIQIFLVNTSETQSQIDQRLKTMNHRLKVLHKEAFKLPDLPSIVDAKELDKLFPTPMGLPHHVWIDSRGLIRIRGSFFNTYEDKIRDLLNGRDIFSMRDDNTSGLFDKEEPYYKLMGKLSPSCNYCSFFGTYNNEYAASNGGEVVDKIDSATATIRSTFVNYDILRLYRNVFKDSLAKTRNKVIFTTNDRSNSAIEDYDLLFVKDTLRYTFDFLIDLENVGNKEYTDKNYVRSKFCYEQIMPINMPAEKRREYMLEDLNRYFGNLYGTEGKLEKRMISCYILVRTSDQDKLSTKGGEYKDESITERGREMALYNNSRLSYPISNSLSGLFYRLHRNQPKLFLLDETNFKGKVDIILPDPEDVSSMDDLRKALKPYDLDIIEGEREISMLVIREKGYHPNSSLK